MIETAMIFIPTFAMMLGILDFSVAIFLRSTFQHACREGVRYAVTYQLVPGLGHDDSIRSVVKHHSMGFLSGETGDQKVKIRYYRPDNFAETPDNLPGNIVEISVEGFQWGWILPLLRQSTPLQLTARATDRMEGLPGGSAPPPR
jgi:hypothetical protein